MATETDRATFPTFNGFGLWSISMKAGDRVKVIVQCTLHEATILGFSQGGLMAEIELSHGRTTEVPSVNLALI